MRLMKSESFNRNTCTLKNSNHLAVLLAILKPKCVYIILKESFLGKLLAHSKLVLNWIRNLIERKIVCKRHKYCKKNVKPL